MATYGVPRERLNSVRKMPKEDVWFLGSLASLSLVIIGTWLAPSSGNASPILIYIQVAAWIALVADGVIGGIAMSARLGMRRLQARLREEARYDVTDEALVRHLPDEADVVIRSNEVSRITETNEWLVVRASTGWVIRIPKDVGGYEELCATLSRNKPIEKSETSSSSVISIFVALVIVVSLMLMILTHDHSIRLWSGRMLDLAVPFRNVDPAFTSLGLTNPS
jgi:hypothetical protein